MTNNDAKVSLSKEIHTSVEKLYDAWTQPEQLKQWWKPMNKKLSEVTNDLKEGGTIKYAFEDDSLFIEGKYITVQEKQKLVYTWKWHLPKDDVKDSNYQLTIEFSANNDSATIYVAQEILQNEEGTLVHKEGWEDGLNSLKEYLETADK